MRKKSKAKNQNEKKILKYFLLFNDRASLVYKKKNDSIKKEVRT